MVIEFSVSEVQICLTCQRVYMPSPSPLILDGPYRAFCSCEVAAYVPRAAVFWRWKRSSGWSLGWEEWGELPEGFTWTTAPPSFSGLRRI